MSLNYPRSESDSRRGHDDACIRPIYTQVEGGSEFRQVRGRLSPRHVVAGCRFIQCPDRHVA